MAHSAVRTMKRNPLTTQEDIRCHPTRSTNAGCDSALTSTSTADAPGGMRPIPPSEHGTPCTEPGASLGGNGLLSGGRAGKASIPTVGRWREIRPEIGRFGHDEERDESGGLHGIRGSGPHQGQHDGGLAHHPSEHPKLPDGRLPHGAKAGEGILHGAARPLPSGLHPRANL